MPLECPYCGHAMQYPVILPPLSMRQQSIYNAVVASGADGITSEALTNAMMAGNKPRKSSYGVLRVQIHEINRKLTSINQKIQGHRSYGYRLVSIHEPIN